MMRKIKGQGVKAIVVVFGNDAYLSATSYLGFWFGFIDELYYGRTYIHGNTVRIVATLFYTLLVIKSFEEREALSSSPNF